MIHQQKPEDFRAAMVIVSCYIMVGNHFLLLQRHPDKLHGEKWGLPAGKVDAGEAIEDAVIREVFEETAIKIVSPQALGHVFVRHEGAEFDYHSFLWRASERLPVTLSATEHIDYKWVTKGEASQMNLIHDLAACTQLYFC